jgi:hypothetical protein
MRVDQILLAAILFGVSRGLVLADGFDLNRFQEVKNGKTYPAKIVYLKEDATEGKQGEAGTVPALKLELSPMPNTSLMGIELMAQIDHLVMQNITTLIATKRGRIGVDVWASPSFKRVPNEDANSKVGAGNFNGYLMTPPDMDFWIIGTQHSFFSYLKAGQWTHVEGDFQIANTAHFEFHVPPGTGFIYLKNFVAKPRL